MLLSESLTFYNLSVKFHRGYANIAKLILFILSSITATPAATLSNVPSNVGGNSPVVFIYYPFYGSYSGTVEICVVSKSLYMKGQSLWCPLHRTVIKLTKIINGIKDPVARV